MGQAEKIEKDNKVVVRVEMDCEACKQRARKALKNFPGIENIDLDMDEQKVTVKGNVDAWKVYEALRKKCGRRTILLYPQLSKEEERKAKEDSIINSVNKIVESITDLLAPKPPNTVVELGVRMHCGACAKKIKRILLRLDGVTNVEGDMATNKVVVKGRDLDAEVICKRVTQSGKPCEVISFKKEEKASEKKGEQSEKKLESKEAKKETEDAPGKQKTEEKEQKAPGSQVAEAQGKENEEKGKKVQVKEKNGKKKEAKKAENIEDRKIENTEASRGEKKEDLESNKSMKEGESKDEKQLQEGNQTNTKGKNTEGTKDGNEMEKKQSNLGDKKEIRDHTNEWEQAEMDLKKFIYTPRSLPEYAYAPQIFSDENPNACILM